MRRFCSVLLVAAVCSVLGPLACAQEAESPDPNQDVWQCTMNLKKIHQAIQDYRREHKSVPN